MSAVGTEVRARLALVAMGVHVVTAPLWLGGLFPWGVLCGAMTGWCAMVASFWAGGARQLSPRAALCLGAIALATLFTLLQAVPWPCHWVADLHPAAHANARAAAGLGGMHVPCTLSMDHTNTWLEVVKGCGILCSATAAFWLGRRRARPVLALCALSGLLIALLSLVHWGAGLDTVLGLYRPRRPVGGPLFGPIINANHLGGFLVLGLAITVGLALDETRRERVAGCVAAALAMVITILLTQSRGAIGGVLLVLFIHGVLLAVRRRRGLSSSGSIGRWGVVAGVVVAAAGLALGGLFESLAPLADHDVSKLGVPRALLPALGSPFFGVGRGATTVAILPHVTGTIRFTHVESFPVQWAFEWGPWLAVPLILLLGLTVVSALASARRYTVAGGGIGALVLALQNVADYGLEMSGVALVAAVVLGTLLGDGPRAGSRMWGGRIGWRAQATFAAALAVAIAVISPSVLGRSLAEHRRHLDALSESGAPSATIDAALRRAVADHPAEPTFAIAAAAHALRLRRSDAVRWVNRAMQLAPRWAAPHLLAARALWNVGARGQALMELGDALQADPSASVRLLCQLAKRDARVLQQVLERQPVADPEAKRLQGCVRLDDPAGDAVDRWLEPRYPVMGAVLTRMRGRAKDVTARRDLEALVRARLEEDGKRVSLWAELVRLQRDNGDSEGALRTTGAALEALGAESSLLALRAELLAAGGRINDARATLSRLRELAAGDPEELAAMMALTARLERRHGEPLLALSAFRKAFRYSGNLAHLLSVAAVAEELGDADQARRVSADVCRRAEPPMRARACALADRLAAAPRGLFPSRSDSRSGSGRGP